MVRHHMVQQDSSFFFITFFFTLPTENLPVRIEKKGIFVSSAACRLCSNLPETIARIMVKLTTVLRGRKVA